MNIYFLNYNNYFNRQIKRKALLEDYSSYVIYTTANANFSYGDGIDTTYVANYPSQTVQNPNYVLVSNGTELSRWFVIDAHYNRLNQYVLRLHRDVVADYYEETIEAPCFIEKATLLPGDPFIFNSEGMQFNQIKTSETLIKDATNAPWILAFIPKHSTSSSWEDETVEIESETVDYYAEFNSTSDLLSYLHNDEHVQMDKYSLAWFTNPSTTIIDPQLQRKNEVSSNHTIDFTTLIGMLGANGWTNNDGTWPPALSTSEKEYLYDLMTASLDLVPRSTYVNTIINYNGKRVKVGNNYYDVSISLKSQKWLKGTFKFYDTVYLELETQYTTVYGSGDRVYYEQAYQTIEVTLTQYIPVSSSFKINKDRRPTRDQVFDIVAFPYYDGTGCIKNNNQAISVNKDSMMQLATKMASVYGAQVIYDLQLVPYCPIEYLSDGTIELNGINENEYHTIIKDIQNNILGAVFYVGSSTGTFTIPWSIVIDNPKIQSETDMWRLCGPNYNSAYEMNVCENGGVDTLNIDYTYLPGQSWIHINPNFKNLNGADYNDVRGLIVTDPMSLSQVSNAWANYQLTNMNYENIFNREIKSMKKSYKYSLVESLTSGIISGAGSTAATAMLGGGPIGAAAMGVANVGGLIADTALGHLKYKESMSYKTDMYNYNLQNIQAIPNTISKLTGFNENSKIWPFMEYYTCTDEEKEALANKIRYNGMTVMRIGKIKDYIRDEETFIQGQIIRIEDINDDYHVVNEIANEIKQGIFIKGDEIE